MKKQWIDFKQLRAELDFARVLEHYGIETSRAKGSQLTCRCPLPGHDGEGKSKSFSAELEKGIFQCFGCGAKGNLLDFATLMEGGDPENGADLRAAALTLCREFGISTEKPSRKRRSKSRAKASERTKAKSEASPTKPEEQPAPQPEPASTKVNEPLTFELRSLDPSHPFFAENGVSLETVRHFGLGYCKSGLMKGRIAIPLHDDRGQLIGYAGRLVEAPEEDEAGDPPPRYLLPPAREVDGIRFEFHKSEFLYQGHRLDLDADYLYLVEGFRDAWSLWQAGFTNCCALMGSSPSERQIELILAHSSPESELVFLFDAD